MFLECAPYDPPTPRRSKRSVVNDDQSKPPSSKKREAVTTADQWKSESLVDDHDIVLVSEEPIVVSPTADDVTDSDMERQRLAKNVGGWISPAFLKEIDRSWLQRNTPPERFDLKTYCPQVGDTVL